MTEDGDIDMEVQDLREKMKRHKIPAVLPESQMVEDTVVWTPNGVDPVNPEHAHYLETFGLTFKKMLIAQIDTAMKQAADERIDNKMSQVWSNYLVLSFRENLILILYFFLSLFHCLFEI